jgi:16S rRNA (uracil1498-N3)-methyltransferase
MDAAVRDATMMGAEAIVPLLTAHSDVKPSFARRPETLDRWRRVALASAKQCRRATLPVISECQDFAPWIAAPAAEMRLIFVEPSAGSETVLVTSLLAQAPPGAVTVLLGPEGGWSAHETAAALAAACVTVSLGPLTLRADAMPVAALAMLQGIWPG